MKKRISLLKKEIEKRTTEKNELDCYIGSEFKHIRLSKSMSLTAASYKICSTSYLCKLENNKIVPSKHILYQLCESYDIPKEKMDVIINLKGILKDTVKYYFKHDSNNLNRIMESVKDLTSVRYFLIAFIYQIYNLDLYNAERTYKKLLELTSSLSDNDLEYFTLFSAIYNYYSGDFLEALDSIKILEECRDEEISYGYATYYFYINLAMCNMDTIKAYNSLFDIYLHYGEYDEINKISYYMAIYYLKFNCINGYKDMINRVNDTYKKYLDFYYSWLINGVINKTMSKKEINEFSKCLVYLKNRKEFVKDSLSSHYGLVEPDYDYYYLEYQLIDDLNSKVEYIENMVDYLKRSPNEFLRIYFLNETLSLALDSCRYRTFCRLAMKLANQKG